MRHSAVALLVSAVFLSSTMLHANADWTASGQFNYTDRLYDQSGFTGTLVRPVREADVEVYDLNTSAVLGSGATDTNGDFSIFIVDSSTRDVGVRVLSDTAQSPTLNFRVVDDLNADAIYAYHDAGTDVLGHSSSSDVNFGTMTMPAAIGTVATTDWSSQIFNTFDMCVLVADYIASVDGSRPAVQYVIGWNPTNGRGGSFYNGGSNRLSLSDDDAYDDPNIIHEIGHYVEDKFGFSQNTGGTHFIGDDDQDPRLSFSEGFATFVSNATLDFNSRPRPDIYCDRDSFNPSGGGGFAYSLEPMMTGGDCNEGAVNAALYDMIDSTTTADASPGSDDDPMSNQYARAWAVVEEMRVQTLTATSAEDFWDIWFDLGMGDVTNMQTVFSAHSIDYLPDAQEPNDTPASATSLVVGGGYQENSFYKSGTATGGDEDWFSFTATSGTYYRIEVNGAANSMFGRPDPQMFLLDPALSEVLAFSDDRLDTVLNTQSSNAAQDMLETVPEVIWQAPAGDTYYVYLRHASFPRNLLGRYGTYQVRVQSISPPTPTVTQAAAQRMLQGQPYEVLVTGSNFARGATVSVSGGSIAASNVTWLASSALVIEITPAAGTANGSYDLTVSNPGAGSGLLASAVEVNASAQPPVFITEVELGADRVEVRNFGTAAATLTNWEISSYRPGFATATFTFPAFVLPAGATVVVDENGGTDTATDLFDQGGVFNWPWFNGDAGGVSLVDDGNRNVDFIRFVDSFVNEHAAPLGTGGAWMQPEFQSPAVGFTLSRAEFSAQYRTARGLSGAQITMPAGSAGRQNAADPHEDNDEPRRANLIGREATLPNLAISLRTTGLDDDWFGVMVRPGDEIICNALFSHSSGNLEMELYAPGEESTPLLTATSTTDDETITLTSALSTSTGGGVYRLRVFASGSVENAYTLELLGTQDTEIGVTKGVSDPTPDENDTITYSIVATNAGPIQASGLVITDSVPTSVTFVSASTTNYNSSTGFWTIGGLPANASTSLTITVTVDPPTSWQAITNTAAVFALDQTDSISSNDSDVAVINVNDVTAPNITSPSNLTVACDESTAPSNTGSAVATDNCDSAPDVSFSDSVATGACVDAFVITRTWTATDFSGNMTNADQTITVQDVTAPVLTIPSNMTVECDQLTDPGATGIATATDNCDPTPSVTSNDTVTAGACPEEAIITRVWTATDVCGNSSMDTQTITLVDTKAPMITNCAPDQVVDCITSVPASDPNAVGATDNCSTAVTVSVIATNDNLAAGCAADSRLIEYVYEASDECGNTTLCTQTITIVDTTAPVITNCAPEQVVDCITSVPASDPNAVGATDNCSTSVTVSVIGTNDNLAAGCAADARLIEYVYEAADECGNTTLCTQTITIVDTTAPVITNCAPEQVVDCITSVPASDPNAVGATDNCSTSVTVSVIGTNDNLAAGCAADARLIEYVYEASDECGNTALCTQTITVVDATVPVLTTPSNVTVECDQPTDPSATGIATATDNCDPTPSVTSNDAVTGGACPEEAIITRVWTATDVCGNSSADTQTITVVDTTPPVLLTPSNVTVECDQPTDPAATGVATATDNCDQTPSVTSNDTVSAGACSEESIITREWTATDACGNSAVDTQIITAVDTTAPVIANCAPDQVVACITSVPASDPNAVGATDNCSTSVTVSVIGTNDNLAAGCAADPRLIAYVYEAADDCGNTALCTQTITIVDATAPVITNCVPDQVVDCITSVPAPDPNAVGATDNCSTSLTVTVIGTNDNLAGGCTADPRHIEYVYEASDDCGNTLLCTQTISVVDTVPPVLLTPTNVTVECDQSTDPAATGVATATDNCDLSAAVSSNDTVTAGACLGESIITRVWTATDACGNSVSDTQTLTVVDITPPVLLTPSNVTVECDQPTDSAATGIATANDNCDPTPSVTSNDTVTAGACPEESIITRVWTAIDACGNSSVETQTITAVDTTAPVIANCAPDQVVDCVTSVPAPDPDAVGVTDNCSTSVTVSVIGTNDNVAGGCTADPRIIEYVYEASDTCGNTALCTQTITVVDTTPPVLVTPSNVTVECDQPTDPATTGIATANDNCDPTPLVTSNDTVSVGACPEESIISREWTATDACGNSVSDTQTITVADTTSPVLVAPSNVTVECDQPTDPAATGVATATDNCDQTPSVTSNDTVSAGACSEESIITREWTATDACGNSAVDTQIITAVDTTAPVIANCAPDQVVDCITSVPESDPNAVGATDNCSTSVTVSVLATNDNLAGGCEADPRIIEYVYEASDTCGNTALCTQTITVVDATPPVLVTPSNVTVQCDQLTDPATTGVATATDNCDPTPSVTPNDTITAGACPEESIITRVWTATDACGNSAVDTQTISVVDTMPPQLIIPADVTIGCGEDTSPANTGSASATDSCDAAPSISFSDAVVLGACPQGRTITRSWTATDACGNSVMLDQIITLELVDLDLRKSVSDPAPVEGLSISYSLAVTNHGPDQASGIVVQDVLPSNVTFSATSSTDYDSGSGFWTLNTLSSGGSTSMTIIVGVHVGAAGSSITNQSSIQSVDQAEMNLVNNTGEAIIEVQPANLAFIGSSDIVFVDGQGMRLEWPVIPTLTYRIATTPDLPSDIWTIVFGPATAGTGQNQMIFTDPGATNLPHRAYRIELVP